MNMARPDLIIQYKYCKPLGQSLVSQYSFRLSQGQSNWQFQSMPVVLALSVADTGTHMLWKFSDQSNVGFGSLPVFSAEQKITSLSPDLWTEKRKENICQGAAFNMLQQENMYNPFNSVNCGEKEIVLSPRFQKRSLSYSTDALSTIQFTEIRAQKVGIQRK